MGHPADPARISEAMLDFNKQVNATIGDQREVAEIFDGGVNAFSRYEKGKTQPPLALVKLLRVLDGHPELRGEVRVDF